MRRRRKGRKRVSYVDWTKLRQVYNLVKRPIEPKITGFTNIAVNKGSLQSSAGYNIAGANIPNFLRFPIHSSLQNHGHQKHWYHWDVYQKCQWLNFFTELMAGRTKNYALPRLPAESEKCFEIWHMSMLKCCVFLPRMPFSPSHVCHLSFWFSYCLKIK